ncbi:hypothetical protein DFJ77DRAFT_444922 [Powellomyces hirtus]|nr:hypothetical protein DFJ77DRAFT_444922 [Powellomyces hirtus]
MKIPSLLLCIAFALSCVLSVSALQAVTGTITTNQILQDLKDLGPAKVYLNGGQYVAYVEEDGAFSFPNVPQGSHVLSVVSNLYQFDLIRIDVSPTGIMASLTHPGTSWNRQGPPILTPLEMRPRGKFDFFLPREGFNPWSLLSNPMLLMSGFSMIMFFVMPKMMANLPEEVQEEAKGRREEMPQMPQMPDISQGLANWFAPQAPAKASGKRN